MSLSTCRPCVGAVLVMCLGLVSAVVATAMPQAVPPTLTRVKAADPWAISSRVTAIHPLATTLLPPTLVKAFDPTVMPGSGTSTMTFTLGNPNGADLTGVGFTDHMPSGLYMTDTGSLNCPNYAVVLSNGGPDGYPDLQISVSPLAANSTCTFSFPVHVTSPGTFPNITSAVSSNETGAGPTSNTASLDATAPIPMMSWPAVIVLAGILALVGLVALRMRA